MHPLDSIAIKTRSALKECEDTLALKKLWGNDYSAGNIVMAMNKLRYKDGKGDPRGFVTFLDNQKLPGGILPCYRGNRLHILFHICGVFIQHYSCFHYVFGERNIMWRFASKLALRLQVNHRPRSDAGFGPFRKTADQSMDEEILQGSSEPN